MTAGLTGRARNSATLAKRGGSLTREDLHLLLTSCLYTIVRDVLSDLP